ncbi:MAG TPA: hypothetical protein VE869_15505 [Gemmatimonas sp.]|nr:hypothetical protein [Gemmatimonas sp.]
MIRFMRLRAAIIIGVLAFMPIARAAAQAGSELARLIALYRAGNLEQAVTGLQALVRVAETGEQRALLEYHLGVALLKARPTESAAAWRRSISLDPDLRQDAGASDAERSAWEATRAQMRIPVSIRFEPAVTISGAGDSLGLIVDVPVATGVAAPRARVLLAVSQGRDPLELWSGTAGDRGMWDGSFGAEPARAGAYPLIVEVFDEAGAAPLRWRRMLDVTVEPVTQVLSLAPRPPAIRSMVTIRVSDMERRKRARRSGMIWALGGGLISFAASRAVPDVINLGAPNSGPRIALASVYGAGLASTLYGSMKLLSSATRKYETTVVVPDEGALQRQRSAESVWLADSVRVTSLNARRESLRRVTVRVRERR